MATKSVSRQKRKRIIYFLVIIFALAVLLKTGFLIYDYYFEDLDTLAQIVPAQADFYAHLNQNKHRSASREFGSIINEKTVTSQLKDQFLGSIQEITANLGINWSDWPTVMGDEIAVATWKDQEDRYPILILKTNDVALFEQTILVGINRSSPWTEKVYSGLAIKNKSIERAIDWSQIIGNGNFSTDSFYYTKLGQTIVISTAERPLQQAIDTFQKKEKSLQPKRPARYKNEPFYFYWKLNQAASGNDLAPISQLKNIGQTYAIKELFGAIDAAGDHLNITVESKPGWLSSLQINQALDSELLAYLPQQFSLAFYEKDLGENLKNYQNKLLGQYLDSFDQNSLSLISVLFPDKKILNQFSSAKALIIFNEAARYLVVVSDDLDKTAENFKTAESFLKQISAYANPSERTSQSLTGDNIIELWPDINQVEITPETTLAENIYSLPYHNEKIFYGYRGKDIFISDSEELIKQSLQQSQAVNLYADALSSCQSAWQNEILIWPIHNFSLPFFGSVADSPNFLMAGSQIADGDLRLNGCLF